MMLSSDDPSALNHTYHEGLITCKYCTKQKIKQDNYFVVDNNKKFINFSTEPTFFSVFVAFLKDAYHNLFKAKAVEVNPGSGK